jgi:hypothetical protein
MAGPSLMPGWFPEFAERELAADTDQPEEAAEPVGAPDRGGIR